MEADKQRLIAELLEMKKATRRARLTPGDPFNTQAAPVGWWVLDEDERA